VGGEKGREEQRKAEKSSGVQKGSPNRGAVSEAD